jgi:DNA polymerase III delta subunit
MKASQAPISNLDFFKKYFDANGAPLRKMPQICLLLGEDAFIEKQIKEGFKKNSFEVHSYTCKKTGVDGALVDLCAGTSLFSPQIFVWADQLSAPSGWDREGKENWEQLSSKLADPNLSVFFRAPADKRIQWSSLGIPLTVQLSAPGQLSRNELEFWAQWMCESKKIKLEPEKMEFLFSLEMNSLFELEQNLEFWDLGGDTWAARALGWGKKSPNTTLSSNENPAFAWVDAVLRGDRRSALLGLRELENDGAEALPLLGLLSKSLRILADLEMGIEAPSTQPSFLIQKIKKARSELQRKGQGRRGQTLLKKCAELDLKLKGMAGGISMPTKMGIRNFAVLCN